MAIHYHTQMQTIITNEGRTFEVSDETALKLGKLLQAVMEDTDTSDGIPLSNVDGAVFEILLGIVQGTTQEKQLDVRKMIEVMEAANFLNNQEILDKLAPLVADQIRGKTAEQIRNLLGLEDDFTEEERREIEKEQAWFMQQDSILN